MGKARVVEAPLEDRFKRMTEDIEKNNEACDAKIRDMQSQMQDLSKKFDQQEVHMQNQEEAVKQEFVLVRAETATQFKNMTETFQRSLTSSLSKQDQQINSQFAELRNLLLQKPNPAKKAKAGPTEEKESEL